MLQRLFTLEQGNALQVPMFQANFLSVRLPFSRSSINDDHVRNLLQLDKDCPCATLDPVDGSLLQEVAIAVVLLLVE